MKRKILLLLLICGIIEVLLLFIDFNRTKDLFIVNHNVRIEELFPQPGIINNENNKSVIRSLNKDVNSKESKIIGNEKSNFDNVENKNDLYVKSEESVTEKADDDDDKDKDNDNDEEIESENEESLIEINENPVTKKPNKLLYFANRLSVEKKEKMFDVFRVFIKQMELYNLTYMAYGGTLMGISRHNGLIPWDDDIDVLIDSSQKHLVEFFMRELNKTHKFYIVDEKNPIKWKFFSLDGENIEGCDFKYPYIDIFSMRAISKSEVIVEGEENSNMKLNKIYPLIKRPFNGLAVYSPCNMHQILKNTYTDFDKCSSPYYNHELEESLDMKIKKVDCKILKEHYPFVKRYGDRSSGKIFIQEILMRNETVLQIAKYSIPDKCTSKPSFYPSDLEITNYNN